MPGIAFPALLAFTLVLAASPAGASSSAPLQVYLPAGGRTYFEPDQTASVNMDEPVDTQTLVVKLDGVDVTPQFTTTDRRAKATFAALAAGLHTLEAQATGTVFDPFLFQYVTKDFDASSTFTIAAPVTAADFIARSGFRLAPWRPWGRDLARARGSGASRAEPGPPRFPEAGETEASGRDPW